MRIYVAHPYSDDVAGNVERVRAICRAVVEEGHVPIAPHLFLPAFVDETTERDLALRLCIELVSCCDALWFHGTRISPGMEREISAAQALGIPVVNRLFHAPQSPESGR
jgi:dienelactone hydrolase